MRRTPTLAFLLVTIVIDALGLGLIVPIGPALLTAITGEAGRAAQWSGLINASYGLAQFLVVPLLGRMADRYGRRPVLVLALTLLGVDYLVHAVANSAWLLLLAHGLAGAFAGTTTAVNAAVADITEPGRRPRAYGRINAAFGVGFIAGPAVGGLLAGVNLRLPFVVAAGLEPEELRPPGRLRRHAVDHDRGLEEIEQEGEPEEAGRDLDPGRPRDRGGRR